MQSSTAANSLLQLWQDVLQLAIINCQNSPVFTTQELGHRESEVYACVSGSDGANLATAGRDASRSRVRQVNGSIFFDLLQPDHSSQLLHQCMMDRKPPINSLLGVAFSQPPPHAHRNALVRPGDSNYSIADTDKTFAVWYVKAYWRCPQSGDFDEVTCGDCEM
ncbi:hypothetical protein EGR_11027 [Echinococcus granulosus]|uniref:Uncharacterized protein n=1 Tax=Echinococcus granulosus TaxID=6210 RepID=W6TZ90_ECHGR|nr:hypothetical protein EGR_11027 [Echinococcus granulosus]EUB54115.1 hypothetical protein EGR_11027 [Echinococcus granulosus]